MAEPLRLGFVVENADALNALRQTRQALSGDLTDAAKQAQQALTGLTATTDSTGKVFNSLGQEVTGRAAEALKRMGSEATSAAQDIKTVGQAADQTTVSVSKLSDSVKSASSSTSAGSTSLDTFAGSALKVAGAITGVHLGVQTIGQVVSFATDRFLSFDDALSKLNATIPGQTALQKTYHDALQALPPLYGDAATQAAALQHILSSGMTEPTRALETLKAASELNVAGFGDLNSTTNLLIKTQAVYGNQVKDLTKVSDDFITTTHIGGASLQDLARVFPNILAPAKELGVSIRDANAIFALFNTELKDSSRTGEVVSQFFRALIRNSDEFAARGVNLREVIGQQGLAGALKVIEELTNNNATALQHLLPGLDEGLGLIKSLVNDGWQKLNAEEARYRDNTGATKASVEERTKSVTVAWQTFKNQVGNASTSLLETFATGVLGIETAVTKSGTIIGETFETVGKKVGLITPPLDMAAHTIAELEQRQLSAGQTAADLAKAMEQSAGSVTKVAEAAPKAKSGLELVQDAANALDKDITRLAGREIIPTEQLQKQVDAAVGFLTTLKNSNALTYDDLLARAEQFTDAVQKRLGTLPDAVRKVYDEIREQSEPDVNALAEAWNRFGIESTGVTQQFGKQAVQQFQEILNAGEGTTKQLQDAFHQVITELNEGDFKRLPEGFEQQMERMNAIAERTGGTIYKTFRDAFGNIRIVVDEFNTTINRALSGLSSTIPGAILPTFDKTYAAVTAATIQWGNDFASHLSKAEQDAALQYGLISQHAVDAARAQGKAAGDVGESVTSGYGKAQQALLRYDDELQRTMGLADLTSDATRKLMDWNPTFTQQLAQTPQGLFDQLRQARTELQNLQFSPNVSVPGWLEFTRKALTEWVDQITGKLKSLGVNDLGQPLKGVQDSATASTDAVKGLRDAVQSTSAAAPTLTQHAASLAGGFAQLTQSAGEASKTIAAALRPPSVGTGPIDVGGNRLPLAGDVSSGAALSLPPSLTPQNKDALVELGSRFAENQRLQNTAMVQEVLQEIAKLSQQGTNNALVQLGMQLDAAQLAGNQAAQDVLIQQITQATGVQATGAILTPDVVDRLRQTGRLTGAGASTSDGARSSGFIGGNVGATGMRPFSGGLPALPGVITPQQVPTFTQPTLSQPTAGGVSRFGSQVHVTVHVQQSPLTRMDHEDIARQLAPAIQQELNRQRF